jgi:RND family efflux transporter MFP subunit
VKTLARFLLQTLFPLAFLAGSGYWGYVLLMSPPQTPKAEPEFIAPAVGVQSLDPQDTPIFIEAHGTTVAAREVMIQPEVGGRILEHHAQLIPGGLLKKGELLFQINPADYEIALREAEAALVQASADLNMELGNQVIAKREWQLLEPDLAETLANRSLAQREPQLQRAYAERDTALAAVEDARLDLSRTEVRVPFDAIVIEEDVEVGQLVDRQSDVAKLVGTEEFWVQGSVPVNYLPRIHFPTEGEAEGSAVTIVLETGLDERVVRKGRVLRLIGDLDPRGRMARVLITIKDPLGLEDLERGYENRILIGSYVGLEIEAGMLPEVCAIPRKAIRENSKVWVCTKEGTLAIRPLEILWRRKDDVLVADTFKEGDQLITTRLSSAIPGIEVRPKPDESGQGQPATQESFESPITSLPQLEVETGKTPG